MTVDSLDTAREVVDEDPNGVLVVYEYQHVITGKTLWSIEHTYTLGNTQRSEYVINPKVIYTKVDGWFEGYNAETYPPENSY